MKRDVWARWQKVYWWCRNRLFSAVGPPSYPVYFVSSVSSDGDASYRREPLDPDPETVLRVQNAGGKRRRRRRHKK